jgi:SAM-dependent methyltransferase
MNREMMHSETAIAHADSTIAAAREAYRAARDVAADSLLYWAERNAYYYRELARLFRLHVPPNACVLHVGCGLGDTLAAVQPRCGLGIDISEKVVDLARRRHPQSHLRFEVLDPEHFDLGPLAAGCRTLASATGAASTVADTAVGGGQDATPAFDFVLIDHALADMQDIQASLECIRRACQPHTRLVLSYYNALWGPLLRTASRLGLRRPTGEQNWLGGSDFDNLLKLAGFEVVSRWSETLLPKRLPGLNAICNRFLVKFWPFNHLALTQLYVARPVMPPPNAANLTCTVVIPTRNERGNIADAVRRLPPIGAHTEVIFVDGNSTDGTVQEIERVIQEHSQPAGPMSLRLIHQGSGRGKGDAVRKGFAAAKGDVLMILDADLTVPPEDLPRFFRPIADGTAEFVNGTRLVYPMEDQAMQTLNKIGNRFFSVLFTWLLGQRFRDTLCGTKALLRRNYEIIAASRSYFGDFDPFGDFDLIFGAAKANLKIIEVPVRYRARTYGQTNIHRFRHGWLLLKMSWIAFKRLKLR